MMQLSDNILAAFLDGHASADEALQVLDCTRHDPDLQRFFSLSNQVDADLDKGSKAKESKRMTLRDFHAMKKKLPPR